MDFACVMTCVFISVDTIDCLPFGLGNVENALVGCMCDRVS